MGLPDVPGQGPRGRYATADALADDLERVAAGEPISRPDRGWPARVLRILRRRKRSSDDRTWGQVELIEAALNFALHAGLFALIRAGSTAAACWAWYLAFEMATWWVFLDRLFRGAARRHRSVISSCSGSGSAWRG